MRPLCWEAGPGCIYIPHRRCPACLGPLHCTSGPPDAYLSSLSVDLEGDPLELRREDSTRTSHACCTGAVSVWTGGHMQQAWVPARYSHCSLTHSAQHVPTRAARLARRVRLRVGPVPRCRLQGCRLQGASMVHEQQLTEDLAFIRLNSATQSSLRAMPAMDFCGTAAPNTGTAGRGAQGQGWKTHQSTADLMASWPRRPTTTTAWHEE